MGRKPIDRKGLRPKPQMKKRQGFSMSELAELYARRNFLANGQRPANRTFAMTYAEIARLYSCEDSVAADACILAADYARCGKILKCRDGEWHFMDESFGGIEAAKLLGVSYMTVRRWAKKGILDWAGAAPWHVSGESISQVLRGIRQRPTRGRPPGRRGGAANGKAGS